MDKLLKLVPRRFRMIVIRKCPYCKMQHDIHKSLCDFGAPFEKCWYCHNVFLLKDRNEWDVMSIARKFWYVMILFVRILAWTLLITLIFVAIIYLIFEKLLGVLDDINALGDWFTKTLLFISFVISALGNSYLFIYEVKQSKERTKDEKYIQELKIHGFKCK